MEWLGIAGSMVGVLTFIFGAFHYVVLKPLKESIVDLRNLISKVQHNIEEGEKIRHNLEIKVATLEQKIKSMDSKFDIFTKFCMETHGSQDLLPLITKLHEHD